MGQKWQKELKRIVKILKEEYRPEKVILYGSVVAGKTNRQSDPDLVVIKTTQRRFYDRIGDVLRLVKPTEAIDLLVYTPEEFAELSKKSWFVGEEINKKGKAVYEVSR